MKNYYAVRVGKKPGIFDFYNDFLKSCRGFKGVEAKGFDELNKAIEYMGIETDEIDFYLHKEASILEKGRKFCSKNDYTDGECIAYVDGSYQDLNDIFGVGILFMSTREYTEMRIRCDDIKHPEFKNIASEINAAKIAISHAINNDYDKIKLHYDFIGVEQYAKEKIKGNKLAKKYRKFIKKAKKKIKINFVKVKAHSGDNLNNAADHLAKEASKLG